MRTKTVNKIKRTKYLNELGAFKKYVTTIIGLQKSIHSFVVPKANYLRHTQDRISFTPP